MDQRRRHDALLDPDWTAALALASRRLAGRDVRRGDESLDKKLKAFGAREEARQLAEGCSRDEEGRMIPPGWVRTGPPTEGE